MVKSWQTRAVCPSCGWHCQVTIGELFYIQVECCPQCGRPVGYQTTESAWPILIIRSRGTVWEFPVWWNPLTWYAYESWEVRCD